MKWYTKLMHKNRSGFTLVELVIVIAVIAILAAITVASYTGIQARSRDAKRRTDIANIIKGMELYYHDNGQYPVRGSSTGSPLEGWFTSGDTSWQFLSGSLTSVSDETSASPAMDKVPTDPTNTANGTPTNGGYVYAVYVNQNNACGAPTGQMYMIAYRLESGKQEFKQEGPCATNDIGNDYYTNNGVSVYENNKNGS